MAVSMLAGIGVGAILYFILIILTRAVTREDMMLIPKGEKLARIFPYTIDIITAVDRHNEKSIENQGYFFE